MEIHFRIKEETKMGETLFIPQKKVVKHHKIDDSEWEDLIRSFNITNYDDALLEIKQFILRSTPKITIHELPELTVHLEERI